MPNIKLNFSSQWPTVQVAKVINDPKNKPGEGTEYPYAKKIAHGLGYPPFGIVLQKGGANSYPVMSGADVDDTYVYVPETTTGGADVDCIVLYSTDISKASSYTDYDSAVGELVEDESGGQIDMRDFLLHSRTVGPMVLSVVTKNFPNTSDLIIEYDSPLNYPTFSFGYVRLISDVGIMTSGVWRNVPLAGQAWPTMFTDGYKSKIAIIPENGSYDPITYLYIPGTGTPIADKASIVVLRNPAIITDNTVAVTI